MNARPSVARPRQRGLSLIELMLSVTLGMLLVVALISFYLNSSRTSSELVNANNMIEDGRFAIQLIESDVVHAAFWGAYVPQFDDQTLSSVPTDVPTGVPDPCLAFASWTTAYVNDLIGIPLQVYDDASVCSSILQHRLADTDVLVVRHAETCVPGDTHCDADVSGRLYMQASLCASETTRYVLATSGFTLHKRDCSTLADKRRFLSRIYYVRDYAFTVGDGIPTLMRADFDLAAGALAHQSAVPLITGIEGFRVEVGIDGFSSRCAPATPVDYTQAIARINPSTCATDSDDTQNTLPTNRGDGVPDGSFVRCTSASPCSAAQLTNVTALRLYVLARARQPSPTYTDSKAYTLGNTTLGPFGDHYMRHVYAASVRLPNVASRRESP